MATGLGWLDRNEQRTWPFGDDAELSGLPQDIFADLQVNFPGVLTARPHIASISSGPAYVSFVLALGATPLAWYGGDKTIRRVLPLTPLTEGVSGTVVFGAGLLNFLDRIDFTSDAFLAEKAYTAYLSPAVERLRVRKATGVDIDLTGLIDVRAGADLQVQRVADVTIDGSPVSEAIELSLSDQVSQATAQRFAGSCARHTQGDSCAPSAITSINGVRAACDGELTLRVYGDLDVEAAGDGLLNIETDVAINRQCLSKGGAPALYEPEEECDS